MNRWLLLGSLFFSGCSGDVVEHSAIADDFCHGQADGVRCDDGNACTEDDLCGHGVCLGRSVPDNVVCDDGLLCTTLDYCEAGLCRGRAVDCAGTSVALCEVAACDEASGTCRAVPGPTGEACDDGDGCTVGDQCVASGCLGVARDCSATPAGECQLAVCDPASGGCTVVAAPDGTICGDAADLCTVSTCHQGSCAPAPKCGSSDAACRFGVCDPKTGGCTSVAKSDTAACDDQNPCTADEACASGECVGGVVQPDGTLCVDGDPCHTVGLCAAGACDAPVKDCTSLDTACVSGACVAASGECAPMNKDLGTACDDGLACTTGETCDAGLCVATNSACSCTGKADATPCDDGDACTAADACVAGVCLGAPKDCSAKDGQCTAGLCVNGSCESVPAVDGTPCDDGSACTSSDSCVGGGCDGVPKPCEAPVCTIATCDPDSGACKLVDNTGGVPCDDGNPCSAGTVCQFGACVGTQEICAPCAGHAPGDSCDDQNACTSGDTCTAEGALLVCRGEATICPSVALPPCLVASCEAAGGSCTAALASPGTSCDDGNGCTKDDACGASGDCLGTKVDFCGADVDSCGSVASPDSNGWTVLSWLDPDAPTDVGIAVLAGEELAVTTGPHCGHAIDTVLQVLDPSGAVIAQADDTNGAFAAVDPVLAEQTGTYTLRTQGAFLATRTSFLLTARVKPATPCAADGECGCADKTCQQTPAGKICLWRPTSVASAGPLPGDFGDEPAPSSGPPVVALGGTYRGRLDGGADTDVYLIALGTGEPLTVVTRSLCGSAVDTTVTVRGPDNAVVAQASAGGSGAFAAVEAAIPMLAGVHRIEVSSPAAGSGAYAMELRSGLCTKTSDCLCPDRACSGDPGAPGICAPKLDVPEGPSGSPPVLALGNRVHSTLATSEDVDDFSVLLPAATYDVRISGFCGEATSASVTVRPMEGTSLLAAGAPNVLGWTVEQAGTYRVSVAGGVGDYSLIVEVSP